MSTGKEGGARGKKKREAEAEEGGIVTKVCRELFTGSTSRLLITGGVAKSRLLPKLLFHFEKDLGGKL